MGVHRSSSAMRWVAFGWLMAGCATPIREDPPSNLGGTDAAIGDVTSGSDDTSSGNTGSVVPPTTTSAGSAGTGMGGASSTSSEASSGSTAGGSEGSSAAGGSTSADTTDGTGGSSTESTTETSTSTTGGVVIPDDLPWMDDFENYTPEGPAAPNWVALESTGGWRVYSDGTTQVYGPSSEASNRNMTYVDGPVWTDMRFEVDVRLRDGGDSTRIYVAVRAVPAGSKLDYYHAYVRGDGRVRLGKYVGGSTTEDSDTMDTGVVLDDSTWHRLAVSIVGNTLSVELDGDSIDSVSIDGLDSGSIALGVDQGTAEFDNISVTAP